MMRSLLFAFGMLLYVSSYSQIAVPYEYADDPSELVFDTVFIKKNKIWRIENANFIRIGNQRITPKTLNSLFIFNKGGQLDSHYVLTRFNILHIDSALYLHHYSRSNHIIRRKEGQNYRAQYLNFNDSLCLIKNIMCQETNISQSPGNFKIGNQKVIFEESYRYTPLSPLQTKKTWYNDEGKIFKEAIIIKDTTGRVIEENGTYTATNVKTNYKISYDALGRISEKHYFSDASGEVNEKTIYAYDAQGKLLKADFYRNGNFLHEKTYFYNAKNGLMESVMLKYPDGNFEFVNYYFTFIGDAKINTVLGSYRSEPEESPKVVAPVKKKTPVRKPVKKPTRPPARRK